MVLKGIPSILSPDLLHALASMGHGDKIVIADANFPSASICNGEESPRLVRADGHSIPHLLEAILKLMPLDTYVFSPVWLMDLVNRDKNSGMGEPPVWSAYQQIINQAENREISVNKIERFEFYKQAKESFAVVHTGETALYGNIILQKGVIQA